VSDIDELDGPADSLTVPLLGQDDRDSRVTQDLVQTLVWCGSVERDISGP
jgi:hypothetical protein